MAKNHRLVVAGLIALAVFGLALQRTCRPRQVVAWSDMYGSYPATLIPTDSDHALIRFSSGRQVPIIWLRPMQAAYDSHGQPTGESTEAEYCVPTNAFGGTECRAKDSDGTEWTVEFSAVDGWAEGTVLLFTVAAVAIAAVAAIRGRRMFGGARWQRCLKRNHSLRAWMEDCYSVEEIKSVAAEAIDCNLNRSYYDVLLDDVFMSWLDESPQEARERQLKRERQQTHELYWRYGTDIWHACLPEVKLSDPVVRCVQPGVGGLARLTLAAQVSGPEAFEEFMVRNALKLTAIRILNEKGICN